MGFVAFGAPPDHAHAPAVGRREVAAAQAGELADAPPGDERRLSGVSRARKVAALREYFRYLVDHGQLAKSPMDTVETPKRERKDRTALSREEYTAMLSYAGGSARDFAILQVFLQTGLRVSELAALRIDDVDLTNRVLRVRAGKGMAARSIELERKATQAIKNYLASRPTTAAEQLFLNYNKEPISERGIRKLVTKYLKLADQTLAIALTALVGRLAFCGHQLAQKGFLSGDAQQLAWLRHDRQHSLQQIAAPATVANRSQSLGLGMVGMIDLGGILDQQDQIVATGLLASSQPMWGAERSMGNIVLIKQAIGGFERARAAQLLGQGGIGTAHQARGQRDGSPLTSAILQIDHREGAFGPVSRTGDHWQQMHRQPHLNNERFRYPGYQTCG